ncbi:Cadmium, cobalt and zinc/H(+)-K(+) antiporter [Thalassovita gelatinovora]|uniref:Cadmium, cobalt and zinc/H(+)-K(+) antiporter n=1 Tax=Thalassovita gelatinovora TaxID=53501 RepID=A0A0P1F5T5_THAGE|nr:cation diffusion facilitator family transporter [Thalassovita gelatinovora]QIZ80823.1 cation transporter [Thalassovita gelatinovora]CUH63236.1 Cadmium, cobalt and zinc/H(+)-K(+) antiporter [Thalassovita gelatinovora]SEQ63882.1 cobalt-zinc-cadmium efflux system protein [Thalassovita gelatinovora]
MPNDHHGHHHHGADLDLGDKRVALAVAVNFLLTLVQIVAGVISGSLALIADAIHNLSDALSLVIAFFARRIGKRPADPQMTFGYGRAEVVAALINYTTLIVVAFYLTAEGVQRLFNPAEVEGWIVVVIAAVALVIDTVTALLIMRFSKDSVNMRAAFLHNVADALGSVAVIVGGTLILLYDWRLVDPIVTLLIAGYILWHSWQGVVPVIRILMLGAPEDTDLDLVLAGLRGIDGVKGIHHLHVWRMQEHETALESHVVLDGRVAAEVVKRDVKRLLRDQFSIVHAVLELETAGETCDDARLIGH